MKCCYEALAAFLALAAHAPADGARLATGSHALRVAAVDTFQAATGLTAVLELLFREIRCPLPDVAE